MTSDDLAYLKSIFTKYTEFSSGKYVYVDIKDFSAFITSLKEVYPRHSFWEDGYSMEVTDETVQVLWRYFIPISISDLEFSIMMKIAFNAEMDQELGHSIKYLHDLFTKHLRETDLSSFLDMCKLNGLTDYFSVRQLLTELIEQNNLWGKFIKSIGKIQYTQLSDFGKIEQLLTFAQKNIKKEK